MKLLIDQLKHSNSLESNDYLQMQSEQERLKRDNERLEIAFKGIKVVTTCCARHLNTLHQMLLNTKPRVKHLRLNIFKIFISSFYLYFLYLKYDCLKLTNGREIQTIGIVRLNLIKLIAKLVYLNDESINEEIIKLDTINVLIV
jgi:hypothetical protein